MNKVKPKKARDLSNLSVEQLKAIRDEERQKYITWENDFFDDVWDSMLNKASIIGKKYHANKDKPLKWEYIGHDGVIADSQKYQYRIVKEGKIFYASKRSGCYVNLAILTTFDEAKDYCEKHHLGLV
jgi:hypothetical protein